MRGIRACGCSRPTPVDKPERSHDDFMFFGSRSLYERAGFREVVRRSPTRLVMRRGLRPRRTIKR